MPGPQHESSNITGGTLTANGQSIDLTGCANYEMVNIRLTLSSWQGSILVTYSIDGVNFETMPLLYADTGLTNGNLLNGTLTHGGATTGVIRLIGATRGAALIRVSSTAFTGGTMGVDTKVTIGSPALITPGLAGIPTHLGGVPQPNTRMDSYTSAQTDTSIITVSAGTVIAVLALGIRCHKANTNNTTVRVGFGTANTPALGSVGLIDGHPGIDPGGGLNAPGEGIIGLGASNEDLRITCTDPGGTLYVTTRYITLAV